MNEVNEIGILVSVRMLICHIMTFDSYENPVSQVIDLFGNQVW